MDYFAHSGSPRGKGQPLRDPLQAVARRAREASDFLIRRRDQRTLIVELKDERLKQHLVDGEEGRKALAVRRWEDLNPRPTAIRDDLHRRSDHARPARQRTGVRGGVIRDGARRARMIRRGPVILVRPFPRELLNITSLHHP